MVKLNIDLPDGFLDEEIRCDYKISSEMKKVWAVQLDMLKELERVCEKYGLTYFADSGTLIGAIRDKGYIPWDDDIDLVMMRTDYEKLVEVAPKEFKYPYFFQNTYSDEMYIRAHSQLRNSETTGFIKQDKDKPFNKGIFIDVFPLDYLPDNEFKRKYFLFGIKLRWKILLLSTSTQNLRTIKAKIVGYMMKPFVYAIGYKKLFRRYERYCSRYNSDKCKELSYVAYSLGKEKHIWKKEWFEGRKKVPFEFTDVYIPIGYDERLKKEYGNYMTHSHAPSSHGECILNADVPYRKFFEGECI